MILQFKDLKKRLWIGTIALDILMVSVVALYWPHYLKPLLWGCGLGFFYLWSLMFSAENPRHKVQSVFSLTRIVFLAYPIVCIAGRDIRALALVMCGLLSYKGLLAVETVIQALPAFKHLSRKVIAVPEINSERPR